MQNFHLSINDIPPEGLNISLTDPLLWEGPIAEFHIKCRAVSPLQAQVFILPAPGGCLVRGTLKGEIALPCDRCTEDALITLDNSFETFECLPEGIPLENNADQEEDEDAEDALDEGSHIYMDKNVPMLDLAALCWEEFALALPVKPLCREDCKGLCPTCGANINEGPCGCVRDEGDPRLAVLRSLKVQKSKK